MIYQTRFGRSQAGFTLLETLVIIIIIGVLFAIAAPGWLAFLSRQRVNAVRGDAVQALRTAQAEARRTKSSRIVQFNYAFGTASDPAQVVTGAVGTPVPPTACPPPATGLQPRILGNSGIQRGQVRIAVFGGANYATPVNAIVFDDRGNVRCLRDSAGNSISAENLGSGFIVTAYSVRPGGTPTPLQHRCAIVGTILGSIQTEDGALNGGRGCKV
jgi:type II secretory pathway pseudopilin PulG